MKKAILLLLLAVVAAAAWRHHGQATRAPRPADGVLVGDGPRWGVTGMGSHATWSTALSPTESMPIAAIDITGRVLARRAYAPTPLEGPFALDLVLGWGPMSDNRVLDQLSVRQDARGFDIVAGPKLDLPVAKAYAAAMNLSLYSDTFQYMHALEAIRVGDVVRIVGWTTALRDAQGNKWQGHRGTAERPASSEIVQVLMLQVNDQKLFGNWESIERFSFQAW